MAEPEMADLTHLESKLAEVMGLAQAAQDSTTRVMSLVHDDEVRGLLGRMHDEAVETARRCDEFYSHRASKATALRRKASETRSEAADMMSIYLDAPHAGPLDALEFLLMAEAGELGHVEVARLLSDVPGQERVRELIEWALPIQQRHFDDTRSAALSVAVQEGRAALLAQRR